MHIIFLELGNLCKFVTLLPYFKTLIVKLYVDVRVQNVK